MTRTARSEALFARAAKVIPGGVNTSRRKIDPPLCLDRGKGAYVWDVDGNRYLDFHAAWGPIFVGHCDRGVSERVVQTVERRVLFGVGVTELEVAVAEKIVEHVPSAEQALFCGSGSDATFNALRLARAITGRERIVKIQGHFHGTNDSVLRNVHSAPDKVLRRDPGSAGMLAAAVDATVVVDHNDAEGLRSTLDRCDGEVAAVILEPVAHNNPLPPDVPYLRAVREICDQSGALLIFDEVISGFRHHIGGYQAICGVMPDLTCLGKAMANGYPVASIAGRQVYMERFATTADGDVAFAGTYNGGSVPLAAALATIEILEDPAVYEHVYALGERMRAGLRTIIRDAEAAAVVTGLGSLFSVLFMREPPAVYASLTEHDLPALNHYRREMIARGVLEMPGVVGRSHISISHTSADIDLALQAAAEAMAVAGVRSAAS
jgi:glutamate-1-semialdehyde 2,1-aminomutase